MASPSGIPFLGDLHAGAHVGQFYRDRHDLLETLVPYFTMGLRQRERCIWVTAEPLCAAEARGALLEVVPDLAEREHAGQIEIVDHALWYARSGALGPEQVIEVWLAAEQAALAAGYKGLRISGNTLWLPTEEWEPLAEYEARVHEAFSGHKIVALCSYSLSRCGAHEVVDVLRNHSVSLVRGATGWEVVHGATAALASLEPETERIRKLNPHTVEFYRDELPTSRVARCLAESLSRGEGAHAILIPEHVTPIREELARLGVDVDAAIDDGRLGLVDATAIFETVWARPGLREEVLSDQVLRPIERIIDRCGDCVALSELVELFARNHDRDGAIELERWWNAQTARLPLDLVCAYSLESFGDADSVRAFQHICNEHSSVGLDVAPGGHEIDRVRAELAQMTTALAKEMGRRQVAEAAYANATNAREHLILLHRLTASLGEVTARAQVAEVVHDLLPTAFGAQGIAIVERRDSGELVTLLADGLVSDPLDERLISTRSRAVYSTDISGMDSPAELRAFASIPVMVGARQLGVLVLAFASAREFPAPYRALLEDSTRQLALALDRAASYERLEHERARAESASRAKDEFLAMLGHELRNPLSPILTATQLMRLRGEEVFHKERTVIERQVKHMMRLVDDLLDVSRITRGKVDLRRRPIELSDVIAQAVELASPAMEERAHHFTLDVPANGVVVHADAARLAQVISNLLTNAAKYTPHHGRIHLAVEPAERTVAIKVRDNGSGIDEALRPFVFDLFVQGRQGIDRASGGLGLGLAIAKTIVTLHNGTIVVHSDGPGKGSEFVVELPRFANTRTITRTNNSGSFPLPIGRARRVLVVDDNEDAAFLFSEALRRLGHTVQVAHDGPSALAVAREHPPEIAFLDIGLPVMDGYELGRRLRELGSPSPRLVAVTGYGSHSDRERSRDAGFDLHLVKPIEMAVVQDAIAKLDH